ncbi:MAG: tetratricopeptide repeat protein [Saprospirales bacterium]|nr:tetratricopeptide repeat protein [Saprospirales bacterium]MBK7335675.1 tetratricopeptide repeat protein [Saprospirales bacterium]
MSRPSPIYRLFAVLLFAGCYIYGLPEAGGQERTVLDSLWQELDAAVPDTLRVDLLNEIAWELTDGAPDEARGFLDSTFRYARRVKYLRGQGNSLNYRGVLESKVGRIDSAIHYFQLAIPIREAMGDLGGVANLYNNIGNAYDHLGRYENALENYHRSLRIREEEKDSFLIFRLYYNIGDMYERMGNYPEAQDFLLRYLENMEPRGLSDGVANAYNVLGNIHFEVNRFEDARNAYLKSMAMHEELGNSREVSALLNNMGNFKDMQAQLLHNEGLEQGALEQAQKALVLYRKALKITAELDDREAMAEVYHNLGVSLKDQGKFWEDAGNLEKARQVWQEALSYLDTALMISDTLLNRKVILEISEGYGDVYRQMGNYSKAISYANRTLSLAREIGDLKFIQEAYEDLYKLHYAVRNYEMAFAYVDSFEIKKADRYNEDRVRENARREVVYGDRTKQYTIELQEKENKLKTAQLRQTTITLYSMVGGSVGLVLLAFLLYNRYRLKTRANRELAEKNQIIEMERERSDSLLLNILPEATAQELKLYGKAEARRYESVTVLFTDFKSFTQIAEKMAPEDLVAELDECFREFDRITEKHGVEKIKTIGDAYMCAGGLPLPNETHPVDVVWVALEMLAFMESYAAKRQARGLPIYEIRIGIHTGPVVAGIVGSRKFAYDIWGDTVNLASRMESSGQPGKVNISSSTFEQVKGQFRCIPRGKVEAKNKGEQEMFFVDGPLYKAPDGKMKWISKLNWTDLQSFMLKKLKKELSPQLSYHTPAHTEDVLRATRDLCRLEQIDPYHTLLLETAALFHDTGFVATNKDHEAQSCALARAILPGYGFDNEAIEKICGMIMATRIPQSPANPLESILCDADLDYLGREDYEPIAQSLRREWEASGNKLSDEQWKALQVDFLSKHHYFTRSSIQLREEGKARRLMRLQEQ